MRPATILAIAILLPTGGSTVLADVPADPQTLVNDVETSFGALAVILSRGAEADTHEVGVAREGLDASSQRLVSAILAGLESGDQSPLEALVRRLRGGTDLARAALAGARRQALRMLQSRAMTPRGGVFRLAAQRLGATPVPPGGDRPAPAADAAREGHGARPGDVPARRPLYIDAGIDGFAGEAAHRLARALEATGRFAVHLGAGPAGGPGHQVSVRMAPVRVSTWPRYSPHLVIVQRGNQRAVPIAQILTPYEFDQTIWVNGEVTVTDLVSGRVTARDGLAGTAFSSAVSFAGRSLGAHSYLTGFAYGADPWALGRAFDAAIVDDRHGAYRTVMDSLPLEGRIIDVEGGAQVTIDRGQAHGVRANDRFLVLDGARRPVAILRAREAGPSTSIARVYGLERRAPPAIVRGQAIVSRGY